MGQLCNQCRNNETKEEVKLPSTKKDPDEKLLTSKSGIKLDNSFLSLSRNPKIISEPDTTISKSLISNNTTIKDKEQVISYNEEYTQELISAVTINNYIKKIQTNYRKYKQRKLLNMSDKKSKKNFYNNYNNNPLTKSNSKNPYVKTHESIYHDEKVNLMAGRVDQYFSKNLSKGNVNSGFGIQLWQDNAKYIGMYDNDKANGYGIFYHCDGDVYKGEFSNDRADGYAVYYYFNGAMYEGMWHEDVQDGLGVEKWRDNSFYEGEYSKGKKSGVGKYCWADGSFYEGNWLENNIDGYGIYQFSDGRVYKGEWKNNMMNGFGMFILGKEKVYCGFFEKDLKEGFGVYLWNNKEEIKIYLGLWKKGKQHGLGKYFSKKGYKFGKWINGERICWFKEKDNEIYSNMTEEEACFKHYYKLNFKSIVDLLELK